jgi:hypothetical protein
MNKYLFESDFSADSLRWLQKCEAFNKEKSEDLEKLQNEIILTNDSALAYFFATEFPHHKPYLMQKVVLDTKDAKYAFLFAQNIRNAAIPSLQKVVIESRKIKYICKFACFVKGAERKPLESIILKSKNVKYAHMFLKHVKGSDVAKFKDVILASGKPRYLFELAKHTKDQKELSHIEDMIIASRSFTYMRLLAEKIKLANVEKIEQAVLDTDNVSEIKKFAKYVRRSKMKKFFLVL